MATRTDENTFMTVDNTIRESRINTYEYIDMYNCQKSDGLTSLRPK